MLVVAADDEPKAPWSSLLAYPQVWGLVVAKFLSDAAWYFYLFWLPKYLYDVRGFDVKQVGAYAWIPYAAAGVGCLVGGWFSGWLLRRHWSLNAARKIALGASAAMMPIIVFVTRVPTDVAIVLFSIAFFGQQSWSTLVMIVPADLFPGGSSRPWQGWSASAARWAASCSTWWPAACSTAGSATAAVFAIVGSFHVIAFVVILLTTPDIHPLEDAHGRTRALA